MGLLSHLASTRLWWNGSRGLAECDGVSRPLEAAPHVDGVEFVQIDCSVDMHCYLIRRHSYDREEEMRPPEIAAVKQWLHCFAEAVKREVGMR